MKMKKEIVYWELSFDGMFFGGVNLHNGMKYSDRDEAVKAVGQLMDYLQANFLSRMERRIIHDRFVNKTTNDFDDKYWYRLVVVDCHEYSQIVSFGCERHVLRLK